MRRLLLKSVLQALARAIYCRPQLAFFDDPFSGLDNYTAETVFSRIFKKDVGLLRQWGTTVILVTQKVKFLPDADSIISLKDGSVAEQGTFPSLAKAGGYVEALCPESSTPEEEIYCETVVERAHEQGEEETSKTKVATKSELITPGDQRRQRGDLTIYSYFFGTLGLYPFASLLVCEVIWVFLSTFPSKLLA
jgi:ABC-type multidrug transport system ATPase subunit